MDTIKINQLAEAAQELKRLPMGISIQNNELQLSSIPSGFPNDSQFHNELIAHIKLTMKEVVSNWLPQIEACIREEVLKPVPFDDDTPF